MLAAENKALQSRLVQQLASLRQQELDYLVSRYQSIGTQAALVGGFSLQLLAQVASEQPKAEEHDRTPLLVIHTFYSSSYLSLLSSVHAVIICLFCSNWAPGLALRGPTGAMTRALKAYAD